MTILTQLLAVTLVLVLAGGLLLTVSQRHTPFLATPDASDPTAAFARLIEQDLRSRLRIRHLHERLTCTGDEGVVHVLRFPATDRRSRFMGDLVYRVLPTGDTLQVNERLRPVYRIERLVTNAAGRADAFETMPGVLDFSLDLLDANGRHTCGVSEAPLTPSPTTEAVVVRLVTVETPPGAANEPGNVVAEPSVSEPLVNESVTLLAVRLGAVQR